MKYNDKNLPLQCMMKNSTCYKGTKKMNVKGILWHSTGANNPTIRRYVQPCDNDPNRNRLLEIIGVNRNKNDWNHIEKQAGLNCWIGKLADGNVSTVQTMPWDYRPWGCGGGKSGSCNDGWIQFEICEDTLNDADYFTKVYHEACEITAYLCKKFNIDPNGTVMHNGIKVPTILCHQDSYKLGLGSGHADVLHWFHKFGKTMDDVRNDVAALMGTSSGTVVNDTNVNYQGKVTVKDGLNCRTAPVSGSVIMTYPYETVVSITKERDGWGFTGTGWVSLAYIQKIASTPTGTETKTEEDDDMDVARFKELWGKMRKELQDNDSGKYSEEARAWATSTGLIAGMGALPNGEQNYAWADVLTREQMAVLLYRFAKMMGKV